MSTVLPTRPKPPPVAPLSGRPSARSLLRWGALVLVLHLGLLLSLAGPLDWQLSSPQTLRTGPMQIRAIAAPDEMPSASDPGNSAAARTRVALVEKPKPTPTPKPDAPKTTTAPQTAATDRPAQDATPAAPQQTLDPEPIPAQDHAPQADTDPTAQAAVAADPQASGTLAAEASVPASAAANEPLAPPTPAPLSVKTDAFAPHPDVNPSVAAVVAAAKTETPQPERIASATRALPALESAALPPSALLNYRLTGQEKGLNYHASGELRWQRNDSAYAMSLSVKAFLLGSRHWRSVGQINATGLAPTRFSDSWRSERATHFDRPNQRIVFSSNAPSVPLQPGAQDQVSLYVQLAAAMAQSEGRWQPGTRLQIQTATVRDALPWLLTLEKQETLQVEGQSLQAFKWVCQPRNRFDAQVEFWVSAAHDWLPARIRITQATGSFIDLQLTGREALADLPPMQ